MRMISFIVDQLHNKSWEGSFYQSSFVLAHLVESGFGAELYLYLTCIKKLRVECFLSFDGASDVIGVVAHPNATLRTALVNLNLHHFAKISTTNLYLFFYLNEETWVFL